MHPVCWSFFLFKFYKIPLYLSKKKEIIFCTPEAIVLNLHPTTNTFDMLPKLLNFGNFAPLSISNC